MIQERQTDRPDNTEPAEKNQIIKVVEVAQNCGKTTVIEPPRTIDGHELDDYLTSDGS